MAKHNVWMSVSDLMTGLMIIFLFVAVAYMIKVKHNQRVIDEYVDTKQHLHERLVNEFKGDMSEWKMVVGKDLSMKFKEPEVLFAPGSDELQPRFKEILDKFIPKYLEILLNDSLRDRIQEIRIEGHTDTLRMVKYGKDAFLSNVLLSQKRAYNVLNYIRNMDTIKNYTAEKRNLLDYWLSANGMSYGKTLDSDGELTHKSGRPVDMDASRRVEFRIITASEDVLEEFVRKKDNL